MFCLPWSLFADNVTEREAYDLALLYLQGISNTRSNAISLEMVCDGMRTHSRNSSSHPPYYIFNNTKGKGFVIVSGEDAVMPILGYSFENNFSRNNLPENVKDLLLDFEKQINDVRTTHKQVSPGIVAAWENLSSRNFTPVVKHETALWNQNAPYNTDCMVMDGQHVLTGCTATATAILMRYHQWPEKGVGTLPSYNYTINHSQLVSVPSRPLKAYDWENMPLSFGNESTSAEQNAVAQLMADCAVMIQSSFSVYATSAYLNNVPKGLINYMNYDKSIRYVVRSSYPNRQWHQMIQESLRKDGPIIYSGEDANFGHAFIIDGYTADGYYSTNWGWGGLHNGYYLLDAMEPDSDDRYNLNQSAVIGAKKNIGGAVVNELRLSKSVGTSSSQSGLSASTAQFQQDVPFEMSINTVTNLSSLDLTSSVLALAVTDKSGTIKHFLHKLNISHWEPGIMLRQTSIRCRITHTINPGDRIRLYYQASGTGEWTWVRGNVEEGIVEEIILMEDSEFSESIGKSVSLRFNKHTRILQLTLKEHLVVELVNKQGEDYSYLVSVKNGVCTIDSKKLRIDTYMLRFTRGKEKLEMDIKLGEL